MSIDWIFGEYKIIKKIATGGMAEVFLAKRVGMKGFEKLLAIKRILPQFAENEEFIAMFIDEAKLAAKLTHRNIVQIYDFGNQQDSYYIAMEYIFGKDLRSILKKSKDRGERLPLTQCAYIITEAAKGLEYAHTLKDHFGKSLQIIHRDISPQNILISYEGEVALADFGIAKAASKSTETRAGVLKGKLLYMSPEQAWGKPIDRRSDLYSLGVVFYEMVTNRKIFDADSEFSMLEKVRNAEVEFPPDVFANLPQELLKIIKKALEKSPENRYRSAHEMRIDLENYLLTTQERLSEKVIADYLKKLFKEEIEEERKILTESTEILFEKPGPAEPVAKLQIREQEERFVPKRTPEQAKRKGFLLRLQMKIALLLILCMLGGAVAFYLFTRPPSPTIPTVPEKTVLSVPPPSQPPPAIAIESPKIQPSEEESVAAEKKPSLPAEKPVLVAKKPPSGKSTLARDKTAAPQEKTSSPPERLRSPVEKPSPPEEKYSTPTVKPSPPPKKPSRPEEKSPLPAASLSSTAENTSPPLEKPKPVLHSEKESKPPPPTETPKPVEEEKKKAGLVERPGPEVRQEKETPAPQKEASVKVIEQKPPSPLLDLWVQGPQLLHENKHLRLLEQIQNLSGEERHHINIQVLECFAHLKKYVVDRDKSSKQPWWQLYESIEKSKDRNATPMLLKIVKDQEDYTRLYAVLLLGSIGDQRAIHDLQQIANSDPNRKIRKSAAKSVILIQKR
jgi:serine/threonine protein kinase